MSLALSEAYPRSGNVHLYVKTIPGSSYKRSLCGKEAVLLDSWNLNKRKRCPECVATASALSANGVELEVKR